MRGMARWQHERLDEPLTIDADCVASYLERMRRPRMAEFVRHLGEGVAAANRRADSYFQQANALAKRLEALEPRDKPHDPTPPAEASD